jgi:hypothetical protein
MAGLDSVEVHVDLELMELAVLRVLAAFGISLTL